MEVVTRVTPQLDIIYTVNVNLCEGAGNLIYVFDHRVLSLVAAEHL